MSGDRPLVERKMEVLEKFFHKNKNKDFLMPSVLENAVKELEGVPLFETPSPILEKPEIPLFKPFKYPEGYEAWLKQNQVSWLPEEVDMSEDLKDWQNLTDVERFIYTHILRFFVTSDVMVGGIYTDEYLRAFHHVDLRMMLIAFASCETWHIAGYAHLIDTLGLPETEYSVFVEYKEMMDKFDFYKQFKMGSIRDLIMIIMAFAGFTEGMQLYSSFAILLNPSRKNKLRGMAQIISWSIRDETHHTNSMMALGRKLIEENPHLWDDEAKETIRSIGRQCIEHEFKFIELAFSQGEPEGLTEEDLKEYMRYLCDTRCKAIGIDPIYEAKNTLPWINELMTKEHSNFFEIDSTAYTRASTSGTWDDAFSIHDDEVEE